MKHSKVRDLTLASVFAGIILLMSLVPQIGFVTLMPGVSIVLVHIPVLVGIFLLPRRYSLILGLFFGVGSFIAALIHATQPIDLAFRNPLISVLPRVLFGFAAYYVYQLLKTIETKFKLGKTLIFGIVAFISVFAIFFGTRAISTTFAYAEYTDLSSTYQLKQARLQRDDLSLTERLVLEAEVLALEIELPLVFEKGTEKLPQITQYTMPLSLLVIVIFLTLYYHFIIKNRKDEVLYPSAFIISTLIHTILVLTALIVVKPGLFGDALGFQSAINIIYTVAAANGLIEALVAVFVGTPIILALNQLKKQNGGVSR